MFPEPPANEKTFEEWSYRKPAWKHQLEKLLQFSSRFEEKNKSTLQVWKFSFPLKQTHEQWVSGAPGKKVISFTGERMWSWRGRLPKSHFKISAEKHCKTENP